MDDLKLNKLSKNQNMSVVWEGKKIKMKTPFRNEAGFQL